MESKLKHVIVSEWLRQKIIDGTFASGDKLTGEMELAKDFKVSRQTVRQAIGTLVNEGMVERIHGSGTYVRYERTLKSEPTKNIAVITSYLDEYIFPGVIRGIDSVLCEQGYHMNLGITYNKTQNESAVLRAMLKNNVDGFIIEPTKSAFPSPNTQIYDLIKRQQIPVVFINGYYSAYEFAYVTMDDYLSGKVAAMHLIKNGHKKLFGIFKSDDIQGHLRYSGYGNKLNEAGLQLDDNSILWYVTEDLDKLFSAENDHYLLKRIGDSTGIVCYNDEIAMKLIEVFRRNKLNVPNDYSVVSFDNSNLATLSEVGFTSVNYPSDEIGTKAAQKLLDIIGRKEIKAHTLIEPALVIRNSVKKL